MTGSQRRNRLLLMLFGLAVVTVSVILIVHLAGPDRTVPAISLRVSASASRGNIDSVGRVSVGKADTVIHVTVYIPHTTLPLTRYNVSIVTPSTRHLALPSLRISHKSVADVDTLYLDLDREYLPVIPGRYTLILNEIFVEPPATDQHPGIYLYPFFVDMR